MNSLETYDFGQVFSIIPDSKSKVKSSSYLESGKNAVVDQGKGLVAGYTNGILTADKDLLPVIVFGDHTRAVKYIDFPFTAGADGTKILKPSKLMNVKYGYYLVLNAVSQIPSKGYARHFGELKKMQFQLPSIEVQGEIVKKLDLAFGEIDSLEENLQLLENSYEELLHSVQRYSYTSNASWVKIGDVCKLMTGGTPSRTREDFFRNGTVKWLVSGDIHKGEIFDCDGRITVAAMKSANTKILPMNSVMIALNGQGKTRGTVALLRAEATCNQSLVSISPVNTEELIPEFLFYNLRMRYQELRRLTGDDGNDRRGLNMILIREIEIPLPSMASQIKTVMDLKLADQSIQDLKKQIELKKEHAKNLRKVLLSNSFSKKIEVA